MKYALWLSNIPGIGSAKIHYLMSGFKNAQELYFATESQLMEFSGIKEEDRKRIVKSRENWNLEKEFENLNEQGIGFTCMESKDYPQKLRHITNPPYSLYYKGRLPTEKDKAVAIVGARSRSAYGQGVARELAGMLAKEGISVISGLAMGIDADAHQGALTAGGTTFGVLGNGVNVCYPGQNRHLYRQIVQSGGILSEYPPDEQPMPYRFPSRNRIISALSDCVVVIEAREKSGSLITADCAMEQGKDVYALPGRITDPLSAGCNKLIRQGAGILYSVEDFLKEWEIIGQSGIASPDLRKKLLEKEEMLVYSELDFCPTGIGTLMERTSLCLVELIDILARLQQKGFIREVVPNYFQQVI